MLKETPKFDRNYTHPAKGAVVCNSQENFHDHQNATQRGWSFYKTFIKKQAPFTKHDFQRI